MNTRFDTRMMAAMLLVVLLISAIGILMLNRDNLASLQWPALPLAERVSPSRIDTFDYEEAADNMAFRWLAMARFYERNNMLTSDTFDYEQAADNMAFRWLEMARFYEEHGMLNEK